MGQQSLLVIDQTILSLCMCMHVSTSIMTAHAESPMGSAAPNGGAVVLAGDGLTAPAGDPFPWRNQFSMTDCTFINNKAAYGGAIFVDQLVRMLRPCICACIVTAARGCSLAGRRAGERVCYARLAQALWAACSAPTPRAPPAAP